MVNSKSGDEFLLSKQPNRFTLFPIKHNDIWEMYKKASGSFWRTEEVDFTKDCEDWEKLTEQEQHFIKYVLAFFAGSDGIVVENLVFNFCREIKDFCP